MKCKHCGGEEFIAHQVCRMEILVDGEGNYIDGLHKDVSYDIYDSGNPYGPFQCCGCGAVYDELSDGEIPFEEPKPDWKWHSERQEAEIQCDSVCCAYNPFGVCRYELVYGTQPHLHDDGCDGFCNRERNAQDDKA